MIKRNITHVFILCANKGFLIDQVMSFQSCRRSHHGRHREKRLCEDRNVHLGQSVASYIAFAYNMRYRMFSSWTEQPLNISDNGRSRWVVVDGWIGLIIISTAVAQSDSSTKGCVHHSSTNTTPSSTATSSASKHPNISVRTGKKGEWRHHCGPKESFLCVPFHQHGQRLHPHLTWPSQPMASSTTDGQERWNSMLNHHWIYRGYGTSMKFSMVTNTREYMKELVSHGWLCDMGQVWGLVDRGFNGNSWTYQKKVGSRQLL